MTKGGQSQNSAKHRSRRQSAIFVNLPEDQGTSLLRKSTSNMVRSLFSSASGLIFTF